MRLLEALPVVGRGYVVRDAFATVPAHPAGHQPATRDHVDHPQLPREEDRGLVARGHQLGASDLHIEPQQNKIRVRTRIDGVLQHLTDLPIGVAPRLASRIKVLGGADIAEKRLHQDGKIFVKVEGNEVDIRVSTFVSMYR